MSTKIYYLHLKGGGGGELREEFLQKPLSAFGFIFFGVHYTTETNLFCFRSKPEEKLSRLRFGLLNEPEQKDCSLFKQTETKDKYTYTYTYTHTPSPKTWLKTKIRRYLFL